MSDSHTELARARNVQAAMLPNAPSVPGLEIATGYRACDHVGGDFYDFVVVDNWHLGFVMADVSGHGTAAALVMAAAKKTLQMCGRGCLSPRETLMAANEHLQREVPRGMFVSVLYGVLDIRDYSFTFARAGHNPLVVLRANGELDWLTPGGPVLGFLGAAEFSNQLEEASTTLALDDLVVLYTDGLTEAVNPARAMFGNERFKAAIRALSGVGAEDAGKEVLQEVDAFRGEAEQYDDEALVMIRPVLRDGEAAPLDSGSGTPETNLPPHATNLIGRDREVSELLGLLTGEGAGILTVTGTAGIGKTRVALGAAVLALGAFPAGVWHADLGEVHDSEGICKQVGAAMGVDLSSGEAGERISLAMQGRTRTRGGKLLIIFDNADQCRGAVTELVTQWRGVIRDLVVLVTGRTPLGVAGELTFPVRPLGVPARKQTNRIESVDERKLRELTKLPSVELFVARAKERDPRFELSTENVEAVGQLCQRLDGIPLAIELAAARAKVLSPRKMLERLNQRFALLRDQRTGTSGRQSTLRGAIEWSWELLDEHERDALTQLAVMRGGFFLELAEEVVELPDDAPLVMDVAESLHDKSLLDSTEVTKLHGERRFSMFESIRAFALEQLHAEGKGEEVTQRWRNKCIAYMLRWYHAPQSDNTESAARIHLELEALTEIAKGDDDNARWAALAAGPALHRLGSAVTGRSMLQRALESCPPGDLRQRLLIAFASVWVHQDPAEAERLLSQVEESSDQYADAQLALGQALQNRGEGKAMEELLLKLRDRDGLDDLQQARVSTSLGNAAVMQGRLNDALELYESVLPRAKKLDNRPLQSQITGNIGVIHNLRGEIDQALEHFNAASSLQDGNSISESYWLVNLGVVYHAKGELDKAERNLTRALALGEENGLREVVAAALGSLANVAQRRKDLPGALKFAERAYEVDVETNNQRGLAQRKSQIVLIKHEMGDDEGIEQGLREVIEIARRTSDRAVEGQHLGRLGLVQLERVLEKGERDLLAECEENLRAAIDKLGDFSAGHVIDYQAALAHCLFEKGEQEEARKYAELVVAQEGNKELKPDKLEATRKLLEKLDGDRTSD